VSEMHDGAVEWRARLAREAGARRLRLHPRRPPIGKAESKVSESARGNRRTRQDDSKWRPV